VTCNWALGCTVVIGARTEGTQRRIAAAAMLVKWPDPMAFRIEISARGRFTVLTLSGRIETPAITELRRLFELQTDYCEIVVDLKDVSIVGREAMTLLARCEAEGMKLENCTPYIREWMEREKD
jgi:hypothetical protein